MVLLSTPGAPDEGARVAQRATGDGPADDDGGSSQLLWVLAEAASLER